MFIVLRTVLVGPMTQCSSRVVQKLQRQIRGFGFEDLQSAVTFGCEGDRSPALVSCKGIEWINGSFLRQPIERCAPSQA